jgi:predicted RNase H-like nuclease (RuvC/YqgF family)
MSDTINEMESAFKDLTVYSDAQFHTINKLKQEVERLQSENKSLKQMIEGNLPSLEFTANGIGISNEQMICETQISLLKDRAMQKELNADEVRRFSQLFEVLEKIKGSATNVDDVIVKRTSTEDLLKLVVNNESGQ